MIKAFSNIQDAISVADKDTRERILLTVSEIAKNPNVDMGVVLKNVATKIDPVTGKINTNKVLLPNMPKIDTTGQIMPQVPKTTTTADTPAKQFEYGAAFFKSKYPSGSLVPAFMWRDGKAVRYMMYAEGVTFNETFAEVKQAEGFVWQWTQTTGKKEGQPGENTTTPAGGTITPPTIFDTIIFYVKEYWWIGAILIALFIFKRKGRF